MSEKKTPPEDDLVLIVDQQEDGRLRGIRKQGELLSVAEFAPVAEGAPLNGEVLALKPRQEVPGLCDVEVVYRPEGEGSSGPPKVASDAYRGGWDRIFGGGSTSGSERPN